MRTFGVSPAHDSSVCIYEDGKILSFYKEERLSRKKRDRDPIRAIQQAFENSPGEVDVFAYCAPQDAGTSSDYFTKMVEKYAKVGNVANFANQHHLQHASVAFYNSGFSEAAVVVIDRNGSDIDHWAREAETIFYATYPDSFQTLYKNYWVTNSLAHHKIKQIQKDNPDCQIEGRSNCGIVKVYEAATTLIGQDVLENGKTMGLAAYGKPNPKFPQLFLNNTNIALSEYFGMLEDYSTSFHDLEDHTTNVVDPENYHLYADFAWQVQNQTQAAACYLIEKAIEKTGSKNVVISGGYGLNVVANNFYIKKFPNINFFFEPLSDDSGNSIGGAMMSYRMFTKDTTIYPMRNTFIHGKEYSLESIPGVPIDIEGVCDLLLSKRSVAVFNGLAEGGPRALGNRSILFDPRVENSKEIVNKIKKREWYRPFAAMVLEEDAEKYFDMLGLKSSPYMTISFDVKDITKKLFPGVVHVDNTCRIQTVSQRDGLMYNLLLSFKEKTGHGVLMNTSFNLAGEALVETPDDALKTLNESSLDFVWFPQINKVVQ
jgi:carbamoyltransferase